MCLRGLVVKAVPLPPRRREDAKDHEEFSARKDPSKVSLRFLWGRGHRTRGRSGSRMGRVIYRVICLNDLLGDHQARIDPGVELLV